MRNHAGSPTILGALTTTFVLAFAASAVAAPTAPDPGCEPDWDEVATADQLHAEAVALLPKAGEAARTARLLERAAELRPACDVTATKELTWAARAYHSLGRTEKARTTMLRAAERAVWTGDVVAAAHAYLDAAALAIELAERDAAVAAVGRAEVLSASPLLSDGQRRQILRRIEVGTTVAEQRASASR